MAAELPALLDSIASKWEALTPTTAIGSYGFKRIVGQRSAPHAMRTEATRGFDLREHSREIGGEHPGGAQVNYMIDAVVSYAQKEIGTPKIVEKIREEDTHQLVSAVRVASSWTAATMFVEYANVAEWKDEPAGAGFSTLTLRFRVHLIEVQS